MYMYFCGYHTAIKKISINKEGLKFHPSFRWTFLTDLEIHEKEGRNLGPSFALVRCAPVAFHVNNMLNIIRTKLLSFNIALRKGLIPVEQRAEMRRP
jgi:hypothetical protein